MKERATEGQPLSLALSRSLVRSLSRTHTLCVCVCASLSLSLSLSLSVVHCADASSRDLFFPGLPSSIPEEV